MLKKIALVVLVLVVVLVVVIALQPSEFTVSRSAVVAAPPERAFAEVNDLSNWNKWSPWAPLDPDCKYTFEGPAAGEGAALAWAGNSDVGQGKMTITGSEPPDRVDMRVEFTEPFASTNRTEFTFAPEAGGGTRVTWTMTGPKNFVAKAFGLFMNMDAMIGADFEKGLANLRGRVEQPAATTVPAPAAASAG